MQPLHDERLWTPGSSPIFAMTIDECATWIAQTGDNEAGVSGKMANAPFLIVWSSNVGYATATKKTSSCHHRENKYRIGNNTMRFFPDLTAFQRVSLMAILLTGRSINR